MSVRIYENSTNPFLKKYSLQTHFDYVKYLREKVLPVSIKDKNVHCGFTGALTFKDLRNIFHKRGTDNLTEKEIENSISNRKVMLSEEGPKVAKLIRKISYGIRILSNESSFNWLPLGILEDSSAPQAEDRGHEGTLLFCEWETEWDKKTWKKVVKNLDGRQNKTPKLNKLIDSIKNLLNKKSIDKFSLSQIVPSDMKEDIDNYMVPIEYKVYPSRLYHDNEILGINEQEDEWMIHQKAMKPVENKIRDDFGIRSEKLYEIYDLVKDSDLFLGNGSVFKGHRPIGAKMEMPEEEILWLYGSSICSRKTFLEKYRGFFVSNLDTRSKAYLTAIQEYPTIDDWTHLRNHIKWTYSSDLAVKKLQNKIDEVCEYLDKEGISTTNIKDLTPKKVCAALMFVEITKHFVNKNGNLTKDMFVKCSNIVFREAKKLLSDKKKMEKLAIAGKGAKSRWKQFFSQLIGILDQMTQSDINDDKDEVIRRCEQIIDEQGIVLPTDKDFSIFDRDRTSRALFVESKINIEKATGLDKGHLVAGDDNGGFFLQPNGDNTFWSNTRDFVPKEYAVEYLKDVMAYLSSVDENWMLDDELSEIFENTKRFIKYWGFI